MDAPAYSLVPLGGDTLGIRSCGDVATDCDGNGLRAAGTSSGPRRSCCSMPAEVRSIAAFPDILDKYVVTSVFSARTLTHIARSGLSRKPLFMPTYRLDILTARRSTPIHTLCRSRVRFPQPPSTCDRTISASTAQDSHS